MASILSAGTTSATAMVHTADTSGVLQLASNNGTVALTIDTSQKFGFGTTSPNARVDVSGSINITGDNSLNGTWTGLATRYISGNNSAYLQSVDLSSGTVTGGKGLSLDGSTLTFRTISGSSFSDAALIDNSGNLLVGTSTAFGKLAVNGSIATVGAPSSYWAMDFASSTSAGSYVTIANNGTYDLATGSGFVYIYDEGASGVCQIATYYGATAIVWQNGSLYTVSSGTASKINVYYNGGTNKYRIQNTTGGTKNLWISTMRLRSGT